MRYLILLLLSWAYLQPVYAQKENNIWYMGIPQGVDFNTYDTQTVAPPRLMTMQANGINGGASVCDTAGELLFYTNGRVVLDKEHNIMPGSIRLHANYVAYYNTNQVWLNILFFHNNKVLIHKPSQFDNKYLIFYNSVSQDTTRRSYYNDSSYLSYSIVDMDLRDQKGDVPSQSKNIFIDSNTNQYYYNNNNAFCPFTILQGYCDSWLVYKKHVLEQNQRTFRMQIQRIDQQGNLHAHDSFTASQDLLYSIQNNNYVDLISSPSQKLISEKYDHGNGVVATGNNTSIGVWPYKDDKKNKMFTFDFDPHLGKISNPRYRGNALYCYFSPQGSKLLSFNSQQDSVWNPILLTRFDTTYLGDSTAIAVNTQTLDLSALFDKYQNEYESRCLYMNFKMRNASNGKLYILLSIIYYNNENYNTIYQETKSEIYVVEITDADTDNWSVSNAKIIDTLDMRSIIEQYDNTTSNQDLILRGGTKLRTYNHVDYYGATLGEDAIIHRPQVAPDTLLVIALCDGKAMLKSPYPHLPFQWWNGSTADSFEVNAQGSYSVTVTLPSCTFTSVIVVAQPGLNLPKDTTICEQIPIQISGKPALVHNPFWNTGEQTYYKTISEAGTYILSAQSECGIISDTIIVTTRDCACTPFVPNAFTPNNDGLNDRFSPIMTCVHSNYSLRIFDRYGDMIYQSRNNSEAWDGTIKGKPVDIGVYFWQLEFKNELGEHKQMKGDVTLLR